MQTGIPLDLLKGAYSWLKELCILYKILLLPESIRCILEISMIHLKYTTRNLSKEGINSLTEVSKMANPEWHVPLAGLVSRLSNSQRLDYLTRLVPAILTHIEFAQDKADRWVQDCLNDVALQPERSEQVFLKHRDHYLSWIESYRKFSYLYFDFLKKEGGLSLGLLERLAEEIWHIVYRANEQLIQGLWLLERVYSYFFTVEQLNIWKSISNTNQTSTTSFKGKTTTTKSSEASKLDEQSNESSKHEKHHLCECFEHGSKYKQVMGLLVEKGWCQPHTYIWIDTKAAKGTVVALIKDLHAKGFYKKNKKPSNKEIIAISQNTFGVEVGIDIVKRTKPSKKEFEFIKPASTFPIT